MRVMFCDQRRHNQRRFVSALYVAFLAIPGLVGCLFPKKFTAQLPAPCGWRHYLRLGYANIRRRSRRARALVVANPRPPGVSDHQEVVLLFSRSIRAGSDNTKKAASIRLTALFVLARLPGLPVANRFPLAQIELIAFAEHMQLYIVDADHALGIFLRKT